MSIRKGCESVTFCLGQSPERQGIWVSSLLQNLFCTFSVFLYICSCAEVQFPSSQTESPVESKYLQGGTQEFAQLHVWTWLNFRQLSSTSDTKNPFLDPAQQFCLPFVLRKYSFIPFKIQTLLKMYVSFVSFMN